MRRLRGVGAAAPPLIFQRRLEAAEKIPITAHGGRISPNADAHLRASGYGFTNEVS